MDLNQPGLHRDLWYRSWGTALAGSEGIRAQGQLPLRKAVAHSYCGTCSLDEWPLRPGVCVGVTLGRSSLRAPPKAKAYLTTKPWFRVRLFGHRSWDSLR